MHVLMTQHCRYSSSAMCTSTARSSHRSSEMVGEIEMMMMMMMRDCEGDRDLACVCVCVCVCVKRQVE